MTIDNSQTITAYKVTEQGEEVRYPIAFPYLEEENIYVRIKDGEHLEQGVDFYIDDTDVVVTKPLELGLTIYVYRKTDITQEIRWVDGQAIYAPDIMQADDKLTMILQEHAYELTRVLRFSEEALDRGDNAVEYIEGIINTGKDVKQMKEELEEENREHLEAADTKLQETIDSEQRTNAVAERAANEVARVEQIVASNVASDTQFGLVRVGEGLQIMNLNLCVASDVAAPVGSSIMHRGATPPPKYLVEDGSEISRADYPYLFAAIGTLYGDGDGETTFNLPNSIGKAWWGGVSEDVGKTLDSGLPNIVGSVQNWAARSAASNTTVNSLSKSGAFTPSVGQALRAVPGSTTSATWGRQATYNFDASASNAIYGKSTIVQPPALVGLPCIRYLP